MRKTLCFFCLFCVLALALSACGDQPHGFVRAEDGAGYTDRKTGIFYAVLDPAYEPAAAGEAVGEYENKDRKILRTFYAIPELDTALFVADDKRNVYCAATTLPDAAAWDISYILVCEGESVSVERDRFTKGTEDADIAAIRSLWFEGESVTLPIHAADVSYRIRLATDAYPNLYYGFSYFSYESGEAYFYDAVSHRAVAVPAELAAKLDPTALEGN